MSTTIATVLISNNNSDTTQSSIHSNKLISQQLKQFINSFTHTNLSHLLESFQTQIQQKAALNSLQKGYKCYETTISACGIQSSGFGRNSEEAEFNCLKSFFDSVLSSENDSLIQVVKNSLKETKDPKSSNTSTIGSQSACTVSHENSSIVYFNNNSLAVQSQ